MPKKKKGGKKGKKKGKKKTKLIGNQTPDMVVNRLLRSYDKNCALDNSAVPINLRKALLAGKEKSSLLTKFVVDKTLAANMEAIEVRLEPLVCSLRQERYIFIQDLHVWNIPLDHQQLATLALLLEREVYQLRTIELLDCLIEAPSIKRLSLSFNMCSTLSQIILDYNEFGDEGAEGLSTGMTGNRTITMLSLNYCDLATQSGKYLGHIISTTAVRDLYIDGNNLECEGLVELIKLCADRAEEEAYQREEAKRIKEEEGVETEEAQQGRYSSALSGTDNPEKQTGDEKEKSKKKKKKGKKKKEPPPPPRIGPWIHKLHIADNGIDMYGNNQGTFAPLICMRLVRKLIANSDCFEELDLEDNMIGNLGGQELLEALMDRKEAGLSGMKVRTTHRMNTETLNSIIKLGAGLKKKKKGKKKKKKK